MGSSDDSMCSDVLEVGEGLLVYLHFGLVRVMESTDRCYSKELIPLFAVVVVVLVCRD